MLGIRLNNIERYCASYQMVYGYIYKIEFSNGKVYIGLTTRPLHKRKAEHEWHAKKGNPIYVYNAIRKYNMVDTLELIVIDTAETWDELCRKEREQIEMHQSYNKEYGYNGTRGGEGVVGYRHTEEQKQKMSDAKKKQWEDPKARQRMSDAMKEHWEDLEARQKASDAAKKRWEDPQARQRLIDAFNTPQARQKLSDASRKRHHKPFDVFKKDGTYIESFDNQCEALEYLQGSVSQSGVSKALRGELKSTGGFVFKYRE